MDIIKAKQFEYGLMTLDELKEVTVPKYKILWQSDNHLFFAKTLKLNDANKPIINETIENFQFKSVSSYLSRSENDIFSKIRFHISDFLNSNHYALEEIYNDSEKMFNFLLTEVNEIETDFDFEIDRTLYNVKSLDESLNLDFIKVYGDFDINPVTLISNH